MHPTSLDNMRKCYARHIRGEFLDARETTKLLDVGGADVNGSYREVFDDPRIDFLTADMDAAPGVDLVLDDPYDIPFESATFDVVLSGQMLEHCEFFWQSFEEMVRVLKPGGFLCLIAPSIGPIHLYPVDCYRFYPDSYRALAKYTDCHLVELWHDQRGRWHDLVGVFSRRWFDLQPSVELDRWADTQLQKAKAKREKAEPTWRCRGEGNYLDFLLTLHHKLAPQRYLEIGIDRGRSLSLACCDSVGIDPAPRIDRSLSANCQIVKQTSEMFFEELSSQLSEDPPDLYFIDGEHSFEAVLKDFANCERTSAPHSLIIIDDIFPNHRVQTEPVQNSGLWVGDVWKIVPFLHKHRGDLVLTMVDTVPSGLLLITGLDRERAFSAEDIEHYTNFCCEENSLNDAIERRGAVPSSDPRLGDIYRFLRNGRHNHDAPRDIVRSIEAILATDPQSPHLPVGDGANG